MAISKIILNGVTQMDLTSDTVEADYLGQSKTAHDAGGNAITGSATIADPLLYFDKTFPSGTISVPVTSLWASMLSGRNGEMYLSFPNLTGSIMSDAFAGCTGVRTIDIGTANLAESCQRAFRLCSNLQGMVFKRSSLSQDFYLESFYGCSKLEYFDANVSGLRQDRVFGNCSMLKTIVLRRTSITALAALNTFNGTPFASGGSGGTIYIPESLYNHLGDGTSSDYKAATNWSTINGYGTITWAKIEGSYYATHWADGSSRS